MRNDKSDDGAAPGREPSPKSNKGKPAKAAVRRTPAVQIRLLNWPPPHHGKKEAAELARKIALDVEQRLLSLVANAKAAGGQTSLQQGPNCELISWEEVIIIENGVEVLYRLENYECDDGTSYQLQVPA